MNNQISSVTRILKALKQDTELSPSAAFRTNARIRILNTVTSLNIPSPLVRRRPIGMIYAFRFASVLIFLCAGTVYAAQSSDPHDILYPVKTLSEQVALALSPTESTKTSVAVTIISRRAEEHDQAEKTGDTEKIKQTETNFESTVSDIRNKKHINQEKVEREIRKYQPRQQEEVETKEDANDDSDTQKEQKEEHSMSIPTPTKREEQQDQESSSSDSERISLPVFPTQLVPTVLESSHEEDPDQDIEVPPRDDD